MSKTTENYIHVAIYSVTQTADYVFKKMEMEQQKVDFYSY